MLPATCVFLPLTISWWALVLNPAETRSILSIDEHEEQRTRILKEEYLLMLGGDMEMTAQEQQANEILMKAKFSEVDAGFVDVGKFNPASHFFLRKDSINASPVYNMIKKMPKGAALHVHDTALIGGDYVVKNITYRDNLYICVLDDGIQLIFAASTPETKDCKWQLLADVRRAHGNDEEFDKNLAKHFTLETDDPFTEYVNNYVVWQKFGKIFGTITPMLTYKPVWEDFFYESLRQYREDGIFYLELRSTLPTLYDLNGNTYDSIECAKTYKKVNDKFVADFPDTYGSRVIYAPMKYVEPEQVDEYIRIAKILKADLGDYLAGFDLVGQEDLGKPLKDFIKELVAIPGNISVFYHAGETNWYGTSSDYNLIDAVLLGAKRLGHAYALLKHPIISKMVKEKDIALEINPISNQVLMLVSDLRNHPASMMLAENYPVVISSDDPGLWGATPLSHDMYEAFVGLASRHSDIRLLKQLAINSIQYSSMTTYEKYDALIRFNQLWEIFIQNIIQYTAVIH